MNHGSQNQWTDERVEQLKALCAEGYSYALIARIMGGISRNACLGKAARLGIDNSSANHKRDHGTKTRLYKAAAPKPLPAPAPPQPAVEPLRIPLLARRPGECCYPLWPDVGDATRRFEVCGLPAPIGSSWCSHHAQSCMPHQGRISSEDRAKAKEASRVTGAARMFG